MVVLRSMKPCLIVLSCVAVLTACSSDPAVQPEQPEADEVPISFGSTELVPEASTRAVGLETKGIHDFYVWGYKTTGYTAPNYTGRQTIMDKYKVQWTTNTAGSTTSNTADWEYVGITDHGQTQNIKYWDINASSYRFFGIAPCSATVISSSYNHTDPQQATEYDITFEADASHPDDAPYISKLWITNNNPADFPTRRYKDVVTMEFMKPVTKVRIQLVNELGELIIDPSAQQAISSLLFAPANGGDVISSGKLKVSYPLQGAITFTQYLPTLTIVGDTGGTLKMNRYKADYADWYYVLPHIEQDAFQLSLTVNGKSRMATVPAKLMSWNPNMEYTYRFKLTASDVQFIDIVQIGITEWRTQDVEYDIYNW